MALAIDFSVWHICLYIYLCAFYAVEPVNLQNKKKSGPPYAEGIAVGVEGDIRPNGKPYAEGYAVGV
jgi:hypothetical protein